MSEQRNLRKEEQVAQTTPKNFTCGSCKKVVPCNEDLECPECGYGKRD